MSYARLFSRATLLAALITLAACNDSTTEPRDPEAGSVRFGLSGEISGSFDVTGVPHEDGATGNFVHEPFAFAVLQSFGGSIVGFEPTSNPRGNLVQIQLGGRSTGLYDTDLEACLTLCAAIFYVDDLDLHGSLQTGRIFQSVSGQIEVTRFSADRVEGRFDGVVLADVDDASATIELSDGTFAVSLIDEIATAARLPRIGGVELAP